MLLCPYTPYLVQNNHATYQGVALVGRFGAQGTRIGVVLAKRQASESAASQPCSLMPARIFVQNAGMLMSPTRSCFYFLVAGVKRLLDELRCSSMKASVIVCMHARLRLSQGGRKILFKVLGGNFDFAPETCWTRFFRVHARLSQDG